MGGSFFYMKRTGRPLGGVGRVMAGAKRCAWSEANLLPVTKFVSKGFLIKCLGQVDLLPAPLYIAPAITRPAPPNGLPWCSQAVGWNAEGYGYCRTVIIAEV